MSAHKLDDAPVVLDSCLNSGKKQSMRVKMPILSVIDIKFTVSARNRTNL